MAAEMPDRPDPDHVLTWRQRKVLQVIRDFVQERGYPPSMREIGGAVGLASTSSVAFQLSALQRKGYLDRRPRTVEVRLPGHLAVRPEPGREEGEAAEIPDIDVPSEEATLVPPGQYVEDILPLPSEGALFLKVVGDSMSGAGIADGDLVVVRRQSLARDGDLVAAEIDGVAMVRTFEQSGGHVWLIPHDPAFTSILGDKASILGRVVAVLRKV